MSVAQIVRSIVNSASSWKQVEITSTQVSGVFYQHITSDKALVMCFGEHTPEGKLHVMGHTVEVKKRSIVLVTPEGVTDWGCDPVGSQLKIALVLEAQAL